MRLAADPSFERSDGFEQPRVRTRGDPQLQGSEKERSGELSAERLKHGARTIIGWKFLGRTFKLFVANTGEVLDRSDNQILFRRKVM